MLRATLTVLLVGLASTSVCGQQVTVPARPEVVGSLVYEANKLVRLQIKNMPEDATLLWKISPPNFDRATTPEDLLEFAAAPGVYDVEATVMWIDGKKVRATVLNTKVKIGVPSPNPPTPGPPNPPNPPVPDPTDDLTKEVTRLYNADTGSNKKKVAGQLVTLYRWVGPQMENFKTGGELDVAMYKKSKDTVENGLDSVRDLLMKQSQGVLGNDPLVNLDPSKKAAMVVLFNKFSNALEAASR